MLAEPCVIVVNFGSHSLLDENFSPLGASVHVVVVDNPRSESDSAAISELARRRSWQLESMESNVGFGRAVNAGVAAARSAGFTTVTIVNPDVQMDRGALDELVALSAGMPAALISPVVRRPGGADWFRGASVRVDAGRTSNRPPREGTTDGAWVSGACMTATVEWWDKVGGFDPAYFLYWEDVDLSWRWAAAGGILHVAEGVSVIHSVGGTQEASGKSPLYVYFNCRNRLLFARKNLPKKAVWRWVISTVPYAGEVLQRGGRREFLKNAGSLLTAALRGSLAGLRAAVGPVGRPAVGKAM